VDEQIVQLVPRSAPPTIRLHPDDDVVIARRPLLAGSRLAEEGNLPVAEAIAAGHKIATRRVAAGSAVHRYGQIIGVATNDIEPGHHVHTHNLAMTDFARDYAIGVDARPTVYEPVPAHFMGIVRADGRVATRNYIGILTSVNCSATAARAIADRFRRDIHPEELGPYPNVDGVVALTHSDGCAVDAEGEAMVILRRTLAGYARHPNFSHVLLLGLGCEANQIDRLLSDHGLLSMSNLYPFTIQGTGGTVKTIERGVAKVREYLAESNQVRRTSVPVSHLKLALECGGSDGYSGITANPALGAAADLLVRHGGTVMLSETPEIYGAEHLLTRRAVSRAIGEKLIARIRWWEGHVKRHGGELNNNPSAGNKAGGLTTVLEKSLGGITKAGTTNLVEVYEYAEPVTSPGFVFMDTPGYDPVAVTGQVAGGANLICFTTGRGSAFGFVPAPSLKLATNTALWHRQQDDMDINCGGIADGTDSIDAVGARIFQLILDCASGTKSKSELLGYGQNEFVPWQIGVVT
jgi:arabinonate dehydratase